MPEPTARTWIWPYLGIGVAWGCSFLFIKVSLDFLTPFGVAFGRCLLGAVTLGIIARVTGVSLPRGRRVWWDLWVVALCLNILPGVLFAVAESRTTSILAGIINGLTPLTALFFIAVVFRDDPVTRRQLAGLGVGLVGVLTVLGVWRGLGTNPWWAVAALLAAVVLYGVSFPYSRRHLIPLGLAPVALASAQLILATATLLPTFLIDGLNGHAVTTTGVTGLLALGIFGSGFAYMWNFRVIHDAGASVASTVTYLTPVVAVVVGIVFLKEEVAWYEPVGGLIVLLGAAIAQGRFARRPQTLRS
ncbi:MAG TPA: DMT family transporter [Acidimicrobiales bacterium]|nr:DMT family transporter [Acidimicrobiales bacterium]